MWPLPLFVLAVLSAALQWPTGQRATSVAIFVLSFVLVYAASLGVARLVRGDVSGRAVGIATAIALVYHIIALVLPRPDSGWVRVGVGDLMLFGGAAVYGGVEQLTFPVRRNALSNPERVARAMTGTGSDSFHVVRAAASDGAWVVDGSVRSATGTQVRHIARISAPFTVKTTVFPDDSVLLAETLAGGRYHGLGRTHLFVINPGDEAEMVVLPPATREWLGSGLELQAVYVDGEWLVAKTDGRVVGLGRVSADGALLESAEVELQASLMGVAKVGSTVYAVSRTYGDGDEEYRGHVLRGGVIDSERSAQLSEVLEAYNLGAPIRLVGGNNLWVVGYDSVEKSTAIFRYPSGAAMPIRPGSFTNALSDKESVVVSTRQGLVRFTETGSSVVGRGWVPLQMLSVVHGVPMAATKERSGNRLTLTSFETSEPVPFLPDLHLLVH